MDVRQTATYIVAVTFTRDFSDNGVVALPNSADLAIARLVCPSACRSLFAVINRWMIPTAFLIDCPVCLSYVNDPLFFYEVLPFPLEPVDRARSDRGCFGGVESIAIDCMSSQ